MDDYEEWLKGMQAQPAPEPLEELWRFEHDGNTVSCILRYHGGYGVEVQFSSDGDLRIGRRFETKDLAVQWAEEERKAIQKSGAAFLLKQKEDEIFFSMVEQFPDEFRGRLVRDGVPNWEVYRHEPIRVMFCFKEVHQSNDPSDWDLRKQLQDPLFRGRTGKPADFWYARVAGDAHAVMNGLADASSSYADFHPLTNRRPEGFPAREILAKFAFTQVKKVGGGSKIVARELQRHARHYGSFIKQQIALYRPHLIIGGGMGETSPARLLVANHVVDGGVARPLDLPSPDGDANDKPTMVESAEGPHPTEGREFTWWRFPELTRPVAMLEFFHPSAREEREERYRLLSAVVREIAREAGFDSLAGRKPTL